MKIIDISRELISAPTYPGDTKPELKYVSDMYHGDTYNLTDINMCTHNGTHIDAPKHYYDNLPDIEKLSVERFCGVCSVVSFCGDVTGDMINEKVPTNCERLLIKTQGKGKLTSYALEDLIDKGVKLVGIDNITIGVDEEDTIIHKTLLKNGIVIIEGLNLENAQDGMYFLVSAPIKIKGAEAAPCRTLLFQDIAIY